MSVLMRAKLALAGEASQECAEDSVCSSGPPMSVGRRLRSLLNRAWALLVYRTVYSMGKAFGISTVITYLRNPNPLVSVRLLRAFGATIGNDTTIKRSLFLDNVYGDKNSMGDFSYLKIGDNCYIGDCVFFDLANEIRIEKDAVLSGRVSLLTHAECRRSSYLNQKFPRTCEPIVVGSGAWVGFGATIMAGVTIGPNSVIGANALLLQDAEAYCVYVGTPARLLKRID